MGFDFMSVLSREMKVEQEMLSLYEEVEMKAQDVTIRLQHFYCFYDLDFGLDLCSF